MSTTVLGTGLREYHGARLCRQPSTSTVVLGEYQYHVWCGLVVIKSPLAILAYIYADNIYLFTRTVGGFPAGSLS